MIQEKRMSTSKNQKKEKKSFWTQKGKSETQIAAALLKMLRNITLWFQEIDRKLNSAKLRIIYIR